MTSKYSNYLTHEEYPAGMPHDDNNHNNLNQPINADRIHTSAIRDTSARVLLICLSLTFLFSLIEAIGGYLTHSIALLSDAVHMLTDAAGLLIAYLANNISKRPANINLTFGYGKAEAVGALINCVFTLILTAGLFIQVVERFFTPVAVHGSGLFILASIGFLVNGSLAFILSRHAKSLNIKAALIHALGDLFASAVAIIAGIIIYFTQFSLIDPILSLIVIGLLMASNYKLIKKSLIVVMAGVPEHLDYIQIGQDLESIEGILGVHDLHVWYMAANQTALSAHVIANTPYDWHSTLLECQKMLLEKHQISHVTLQHEFNPYLNLNYCEVK
ncbi:MAG: cation diffusion facilitator family transporter [Burkholderiales bacterium]